MTLTEAAERIGVAPATLRRWVDQGLIPHYSNDGWTPAALGHARVVARLRERGHSLQDIRRASDEGRLAYSFADDLFPSPEVTHTLEEAAVQTGLEASMLERMLIALGYSALQTESLTEDDIELLRYVSLGLTAGLPLVALLQLLRVIGQNLAQIADAEVRLFHLYVHEPLMRSGASGVEIAEEMGDLARLLLPLVSPAMDRIHQRYLKHFIEQDVVGHMEADFEEEGETDLGRMRVAIAFADLAGYTQLTEEAGELQALGAVERFVEAVEGTLPDDARVIKTIGDEVMVVGSDPGALVRWAVALQQLRTERPLPRIGIHYGVALYRDGDYYGRDINIASRVAARSAGGEVLATRPVVEHAGPDLESELIGEVRLKGFTEPTEIFLVKLKAR